MLSPLHDRAINLRKIGKSYSEIARATGVPKSTLSTWLKGFKLNPDQIARLYTKQVNFLSFGATSQKERRAKVVDKIVNISRKEITLPLNNDLYKLLGVCLYWAEGSKSKLMQITNSDPYLIVFFIRWLKKVFDVDSTNLVASLNLYPQQNEAKIKGFWSELTGVPFKNFNKTYFKPKSKNYKKNNLYYGTIRIYVRKSTDMKYKMQGWLQALLEDIDLDVQSVQQRWLILRQTKRPVNLTI